MAEARQILELATQRAMAQAALIEKIKFNKLSYTELVPKQVGFAYASKEHKESAFIAGNGTGKTMTGAAIVATHVRGCYPEGWGGRVFDHPINCLVAGTSVERTRDVVQRELLGDAGHWGTGMIPREAIVEVVMTQGGLKYQVDFVRVRHVKGWINTIKFLAYEKGRDKFQGGRYHICWGDEEPRDPSVYTEMVARTTSTPFSPGFVMMTFTPMEGMSRVVKRFLRPDAEDVGNRHVTKMSIREATWLTQEQIDEVIASYPPWERAPRADGEPIMGSGLIFPVQMEKLIIPQQLIPNYWGIVGGLDFGGTVAGCICAYDAETEAFYVLRSYQDKTQPGQGTAYHAGNLVELEGELRGSFDWCWPHDGNVHDRGSGNTIKSEYERLGLRMHPEHSTFPEGGFSPYEACHQILDAMVAGKFYILDHPTNRSLIDQLREYFYDENGKIAADQNDHKIDAMLKAWMMRRWAKRPAYQSNRTRYGDFDAFEVN